MTTGRSGEAQGFEFTEGEVAAMAARRGYLLQRGPGGFRVFHPRSRSVIAGSSFDLTLNEAAAICLTPPPAA